LALSLSAVDDPGKIASELRDQQRAEMIAAAKSWLAKADLEPVPAPKLSADPRESERNAAAEVRELNSTLERFRSMRDGKQSDEAIYQWFRVVEARHDDIKRYMKAKGGR
jgi:hypothetical protein